MDNNYIPKIVKLEKISTETKDIKTFYFKSKIDFIPGQFLEVSCFGLGEAPLSISSSPDEDFLKLTFKCIGSVTNGLFNLKERDPIGIRGPFGNGFPLDSSNEKDIIFIAGGIGIAPLRSLLKSILSKKDLKSNRISLLYGARTPQDMLYKKELDEWAKLIKVLLIVDKSDTKWKGQVGVVPQLLDEVKINPSKTRAYICGPEIMMRFTTAKLLELGMAASDIIVSLERHMKCGMGKCGHCYIGDKFVCRDGPVFSYEQLGNLRPLEIL